MVGTIIPIVYGERLDGRRALSLSLYAVGVVVAAACFGALLGWVGATIPLKPPRLVDRRLFASLVVIFHLVLAHRELGIYYFPLPQSNWQVPRTWLVTMSHRRAALVYGAALGVGVLTRISSSALYAVLAWSVLLRSPITGIVIVGMFGLGRFIPMAALFAAGKNDWDRVTRWLPDVDPWWPAVRMLNGLALAALSGWLIAMATVTM